MKSLIVLLLLVRVAAAEDPKAVAERYFNAGAKAYAAQNFAAAASDFEEAYKALPAPEIAFSAAQAYRRQYRVEARPEYVKRSVDLYKIYLGQVKTGGRVGDAADSLGEMERELDKLRAAGTHMDSVVSTDRTRLGINLTISDRADATAMHEIADASGDAMKGVTAKLDGKPIEPFSLIEVDEGEHVFTVEAAGYEPAEKTRRAVHGVSELVEIELKAKPARIAVTTEAGTELAVDGRPSGTTPTRPLELAAGKHLVTLLHRGREPVGRELVVTRGQELALPITLEQTPRRRAVPWVIGGGGVLFASAAITATLAIVADHSASKLNDGFTSTGNKSVADADEYDRDIRHRDQLSTATWVLGGAAVAAAATAAALYFFDTPSVEHARVTPMAGPGGGGLAVIGRF